MANPDALQSSEPLARGLDRWVTPELLAAVAKGHAEGRRLYIGTTNLDTLRLIIWDMGRIACYGTPESAALFRKVMLASASIPVVFPPVEIPVRVDGRHCTEVHVDGGVQSQVFLVGFTLDLVKAMETAGVDARGARLRVYVIRNAQLQPVWGPVELRMRSITSRAISGLVASQGVSDLYRMYAIAQDAGIDYRLACIPDEFQRTATVPFDTGEMNRLYDLAYRKAKDGYPWYGSPPVKQERILYEPAAPPRHRPDESPLTARSRSRFPVCANSGPIPEADRHRRHHRP